MFVVWAALAAVQGGLFLQLNQPIRAAEFHEPAAKDARQKVGKRDLREGKVIPLCGVARHPVATRAKRLEEHVELVASVVP